MAVRSINIVEGPLFCGRYLFANENDPEEDMNDAGRKGSRESRMFSKCGEMGSRSSVPHPWYPNGIGH